MINLFTQSQTGKNILMMFCLLAILSVNAQQTSKSYFYEAKKEIEAMLKGEKPLDYERAVFVTENSYHNKTLKYDEFKKFLDVYSMLALELAKSYTLIIDNPQAVSPLVTKDSLAHNIYRVSVNKALFHLLTDTNVIVLGKKKITVLPFYYSYSDPLASKNWNYSQVSNLYMDKSRQGNCNALTSLFKLLSLRLNSDVFLCTTQGHIFLTHQDINGSYYNIELASKAFPGSGSIETITYTSDEAVRNGIAMRILDLKQSVGLCLLNLAKSFQNKFGLADDQFIYDCAELAIKYDSKNLNAMLLRAEVMENRLISKGISFGKLKNTVEFRDYEKTIKNLFDLGYREMPTEMKNQIIASISKDTSYFSVYKDKNYYPFIDIDKNYKRSASLSQGIFKEFDIDKPEERFFRTIFDTKTKRIVRFSSPEKLYKDYRFDPVVFAWQIDPLFRKYPSMSPYSAFANNPIVFVDTDGQEFITYIKVKNQETGKTVQYKVTFDGVNTTMTDVKTGANSNYTAGTSKFVDDMVTSYNYIVKNGADVNNAMQTLASSKDIKVEVRETSRYGKTKYKNGVITVNFQEGVQIWSDKGDGEHVGDQSPALGFWSEVYHAYLELVDHATQAKFEDDDEFKLQEENYIHVDIEGQVIDKLKAKDPSSKETKRQDYLDAAWPNKGIKDVTKTTNEAEEK